MKTEASDPVGYGLIVGDAVIDANGLLGKTIDMRWNGEIFCIHCGRKTKKSFNQGYCFPCFRRLAQCDSCILRPELCHFHKGTCREPEWGEANCMQTHYVYLANSSALKVGITRGNQVPTRWMDQGATQALPIFRVNSRLHSGLIEVAIKKHTRDTTNWRAMLKQVAEPLDLRAERDRLIAASSGDLDALRGRLADEELKVLDKEEVREFSFPVEKYPQKISSLNLDKNPRVQSTLLGIKGQYLITDTGVLNIRKFGGYDVKFASS